MPSDPFQDPEFLKLVHELEDLDSQVLAIQEQRCRLLLKLEAMEA